jgi:hypothetical protein
MGLGIQEVLFLFIMAATWLIPIAAGVWVIITLQRIRSGQDALRTKLEAIERMLQRTTSA